MIDREFCDLLEHKICGALKNSLNEEVKGYWCDGVLLPFSESEFSQKHINDNKQTTLKAFLGANGQDTYTVKLLFGKRALSRYARGLKISDCLPESLDDSWFKIDLQFKEVSIQLQ